MFSRLFRLFRILSRPKSTPQMTPQQSGPTPQATPQRLGPTPDFHDDLPDTLRAQEAAAQSGRPRVFDPALKHYRRAFQLGDYASASMHERLEWERARAQVREHLLRVVASSRWSEHLVLRGSALMRAWFGEAARDPKDLDWVFQPSQTKADDALALQCLAEIRELVARNPRAGDLEIDVARIASDEIWTYERAAGRRLVFPFRAPSGAGREIQIDIVWQETLWQAPTRTAIPMRQSAPVEAWAATPALSLAWKLLWLVGDMHPQGKDLYDAVLLAERGVALSEPLDFGLLRRVFDGDDWWAKQPLTLDDFRDLQVDWPNFVLDYPFIEGDAQGWQARLTAALLAYATLNDGDAVSGKRA